MPGTDFFDEDLENREASRRRPPPEDVAHEINRPVSDLNLTRMARHKDDIEHQVANSAQELDRLRMRQEEVERERRELEVLRKKQDRYERGRQEVGDRLNQSLIMMEKEQVRGQRMLECLNTTRDVFKGQVVAIEAIDPESWTDDMVREELGKALAIIDQARMEYNLGMSKVESMLSDCGRGSSLDPGHTLNADGVIQSDASFGFWFKAGLAFCLPLIITVLALGAAVYVLLTQVYGL